MGAFFLCIDTQERKVSLFQFYPVPCKYRENAFQTASDDKHRIPEEGTTHLDLACRHTIVTSQIITQRIYLLLAKAYQTGLYHNGFWKVVLYG